MSKRVQDLFDAHRSKKMGRRELMDRAARLGLGGIAAGFLLNAAGTRALAAGGIDWKAHEGKTVKLLLNKHPYTDAMINNLDNFKQLTGMEVSYDVFPEDVYFDKVTAALSSRSSQYDAFMTGAYQTWQYGPAGWLQDMNEWIDDSSKTADTYNWQDVLPNLRASTAWSGVPGEELGSEGAKQWAVPWGFELNSIAYNRRMFDAAGVTPPENMEDLMEKAAKLTQGDVYGIGARGTRSWATIHPGYLSGFTNFGARDFVVENGSIKAAMNSPEGKKFTQMWIEMLQQSGPRNWTTYTWYEVGNDLGAGASAMIYDADILGYFQNRGTKEAGNIGYAAFAPNPDATQPTPNVWIWSLALNSFSEQPDAGWYFIQWATGTEHTTFGATKADLVNPVRQSVWDNADFQSRLEKDYPGYLEQYQQSRDGSKIYFTPQPLFFNLTTEWAASLQKMHANEVSVDEGLDQLADSVNRQLREAGVSE